MTPAIEARGLCKEYGRRLVVDHLDLRVERGEVFGFLGSNGAGKSTTIRMLTGILAPTGGQARVLGHCVREEAEALKRRTGYMSQAFGLYQDLTVSENVTFFAGLRGFGRREQRARAAAVVERFGLEGYRDHLAAALSGGWKQRLALACAVVHGPELVFLDEPTAGIDPVSRRELWDELYELSAAGTTLFLTTHYMEEAERCHRIGFIHRGRQLACDSPQRLKRDALPGVLLGVYLQGASAGHGLQRALRLLRAQGAELELDDVNVYGDELHAVTAHDPSRVATRLIAALGAEGLCARVDTIQPSIEDVFVALTRQAAA
jgi:ABC-type multidrug transport system ATPase subunit